jgi:hypothetical protein
MAVAAVIVVVVVVVVVIVVEKIEKRLRSTVSREEKGRLAPPNELLRFRE